MKLSSFTVNFADIKKTVLRFPLIFLLSIVATGLGLSLVDGGQHPVKENLLIAVVLGILFSLAVHLFAERKKYNKYYAIAAPLLFVVGYYFFLPNGFMEMRTIDVLQSLSLGLIFTILIMTAPFWDRNNSNGLWHYNKNLAFRFIFTGITTGTLYIGIILSLASLNYLFNTSIDPEWWFPRIWIIVVGLISTTVFLMGIPKDFDALEKEAEYPKSLEIFSKYVLLPLVGLYAIILYAYGIMILFTQQWPKGNVSFMILMYALIGVTAFMFLHPLQGKNPWIRRARKTYFALLIPVIALLFGAVYVRISEYGLTHPRVAIIALGMYLLGLAAYHFTKAEQSIRNVFLSFAILLLVFSFGPVSAFEISKQNQLARLNKILTENKILVDGTIQKREDVKLKGDEVRSIRTIVQYLSEINGIKNIQPWFGKEFALEAKSSSSYRYVEFKKIFERMGQTYENEFASQDYYYFNSKIKSYSVKGYDYEYDFHYVCKENNCSDPENSNAANNTPFVISLNGGNIEVKDLNGAVVTSIEIMKKSDELIGKYGDAYESLIPSETMIIEKAFNGGNARVQFYKMNLQKEKDNIILNDVSGRLLLRVSK